MMFTAGMAKSALRMIPAHAKATLSQVAEVADGAERIGVGGAPDYLRPLFVQAGEKHGVPPELLEALAAKLSSYEPNLAGGVLRVPPSIVGSVQVRAAPAELARRDPAAVVALRSGVDAAAAELARLRGDRGNWTEAVRDYLEHVAAESVDAAGELAGDLLEDVLGRFAVYLLRRLPPEYARRLRGALEGAAEEVEAGA